MYAPLETFFKSSGFSPRAVLMAAETPWKFLTCRSARSSGRLTTKAGRFNLSEYFAACFSHGPFVSPPYLFLLSWSIRFTMRACNNRSSRERRWLLIKRTFTPPESGYTLLEYVQRIVCGKYAIATPCCSLFRCE